MLHYLFRYRFYLLLLIYVAISARAIGFSPNLYGVIASYLIFYLLFIYARTLFFIFFGIYLISCLFYIPEAVLYGSPSSGIIASFFETNLSESIEYLTSFPFYVWGYVGIFAFLGGIVLYLGFHQPTNVVNHKYNILWLVLIIVAVFYKPISAVIKENRDFSLGNSRVYLVGFYGNLYDLIHDYQVGNKSLNESLKDKDKSDWNITFVEPHYKNYVIVIGESVRNDYLSLSGFPLNTTPYLNQEPGKFYQGYVSAAPNTQTSLMRTLYQNIDDNVNYDNNLISLAKAAGFKTYWLSNQGSLGRFDTAAASVGVRADSVFFTKHGNSDSRNYPDTTLISPFENALNDSDSKPKLIVLHLMGSHPKFCQRVRQTVGFDYLNKEMSCYLQSIKETDELLYTLIRILKWQQQPYSLMYFSDHGLSFDRYDKSGSSMVLITGNRTKQNYQIPFFVISSDDSTHQTIPMSQSATRFLQGVSEWMGIESAVFQGMPSFWLGTTKPIKVYDFFNWVDFDTLTSEPAVLPAEIK
ncbi:phosphoethanolamine transferase [Spirabiliibacterium falconis]|uniref:phosphoethanolamine transferase n=1 Tax=Spirabiliibacterium falconis TaxID=572023 RepID=UPI001AAD8643|nr:phosphoethanolamine transferase [Spirabiliibacterium falconis]MBE2894373.1 sulfatase-like hydrolase/transferase [Spirabiliibacterium falconis]